MSFTLNLQFQAFNGARPSLPSRVWCLQPQPAFAPIPWVCTHFFVPFLLYWSRSKQTQQTTFLLYEKLEAEHFHIFISSSSQNDKDICISANSTPLHSINHLFFLLYLQMHLNCLFSSNMQTVANFPHCVCVYLYIYNDI